MVLSDNQGSSSKSVLDDKVFEDSINDSDFDVDLYLNDEEDNGIGEDRIWDKIGNPRSPNHIEHGYSICCENIINMINSIKDLREENRDMLSSINEAIKLMLAVTTNMSFVVENEVGKEESKDNLKEYNTLK
ncbi:hypothetical protein Tco_1559745, partial [Tanacetum coccineum]